MNSSVLVIMTCFNRKDKTLTCVETLVRGNKKLSFEFLVVDDKSTDGTREALEELSRNQDIAITVLTTLGDCFWSGGMRVGMNYAKLHKKAEYCLLVNDDVRFYHSCIQSMMNDCNADVLVGSTHDENGKLSYSGIHYRKRSIKYELVMPGEETLDCDTFNANCVLMPYEIFLEIPSIDPYYVHGLGDFDYGLSIKKAGIRIRCFNRYVGICNNNSTTGTWLDTSLSRSDRFRKKEHPKGQPTKQWFYFLRKNFGLWKAIFYSLTPFVRIMIKK